MLINTVLITGSIVILSNTSQLKTFTESEKLILVVAFTLLVASTLSGVKYYFEMMGIYRKWVDVNHAITYFIRTRAYKGYNQMSDHIIKRQAELPDNNDRRYLLIQIGCMALAFGLYLLLTIFILFGTHSQASNRYDPPNNWRRGNLNQRHH